MPAVTVRVLTLPYRHSGRQNAARQIDIPGRRWGAEYGGIEIPKPADEKEIVEHERFEMKFLDPENRKGSFDEVAVGFHKLNAIAEAMRCLRCDRRA